MQRLFTTLVVIHLSICSLFHCNLNELGITQEKSSDEDLILGLIAVINTSNLADARVDGVAIYFEDPNDRQNTARRGNQVSFRTNSDSGTILPSISSASVRQTVSLLSPPNDRGEFVSFIKFGPHIGSVFDQIGRLRGEFGFDLINDSGFLRIQNRRVPNNLFIRISASRIGTSGGTDPTGGVGLPAVDDEPNPEFFN